MYVTDFCVYPGTLFLMIGPDRLGCGTVVSERLIHRGAALRNFEGEEVSFGLG